MQLWKVVSALIFTIVLVKQGHGKTLPVVLPDPQSCSISSQLKAEIEKYQEIVDLIIEKATRGSFQGKTYTDLSYFVDKFGSRLAGTKNLENAIDFTLNKMKNAGLDNVHGEGVEIPRWKRGKESARLIMPRKKKLSLLGLGLSIGTPPDGIEARVIVVQNFDELKAKATEVKGKIVVLNPVFDTYDGVFKYRVNGAFEVAKVGGIAVLTRSLTPFSIGSPHTGFVKYENNVTQIPAACITVEDAEMLQRMQNRGEKIVIKLKIGAKMFGNVTSRNAIGEIIGNKTPEEVVIISGHIDSWDVGQGAMDNGGGAFISLEALGLLRSMNLKPRRTVRTILWTAEEIGVVGAKAYLKMHEREMDKVKAMLESDSGTFRPLGLDFSGTYEAGCIVQEILKLLTSINATTFRGISELGSDISPFSDQGVPAFSLNNDESKYFYFHHSEGDTMTVETSYNLDLCTAVWAASSYVLADLNVELQRQNDKKYV